MYKTPKNPTKFAKLANLDSFKTRKIFNFCNFNSLKKKEGSKLCIFDSFLNELLPGNDLKGKRGKCTKRGKIKFFTGFELHRHIFRSPTFGKMLFKRVSAFLFWKKPFLRKFAKNPQFQWKKDMSEIISFYTHSTANLATHSTAKLAPSIDFEISFFFEKSTSYEWEIVIFHFFIRFLRQSCYNLVTKIQTQNGSIFILPELSNWQSK